MKTLDLQREVDGIVIADPCAARWSDMEGDSTVRFCGQCNKNVHNLTNMNPEQLAFTLELRKRQPTCVFMIKRKNGSVKIDNCPVVFRATRDRIRAYAAVGLIVLLCLASGADAQTVYVRDVAFYNRVSNITHFVTGLATAFAFVLALFVPLGKRKKAKLRQVVLELIALAMIPVCAHLCGSYVLDNFTGGFYGGV